jgi:hypothetical protein
MHAKSLLSKETNIMPKKYREPTFYRKLFSDKENSKAEFFQTRNPFEPEFLQSKKPICKNISRQYNSHVICYLDEVECQNSSREINLF